MKPLLKPTKKQHLAYKYLDGKTNKTVDYIVFGGGANGGKSWLGCEWLMTNCYLYPGTRWFIGREELKRLKASTYLTFEKMLRYYEIPRGDFTLNSQNSFIRHKNGSRIDLLDLKYLPSDPLYERYGSAEFTGGWIEEAGEVHFDAFDTLKSRINRFYNDRYDLHGKILLTCNPKKNWLYTGFYLPSKLGTLPETRAFIQALVGDNTYREKDAIKKLESIENESKRERLLYGNWEYADENDQLINYEWINKAYEVEAVNGNLRYGCDIARYGDDKTVFAGFNGNTLFDMQCFANLSIDETAQKIAKLIREKNLNPENVGIDGVGLGAGVVDILSSNGFDVIDIIAGAKPIIDIDFGGEDDEFSYEFKNLRSQMWWFAREQLRRGKVRIDLPDLDKGQLAEDLTAPKYKIVNERLIQLESKDDLKKRLGRSPDQADAFVMGLFVNHIESSKIGFSFV